MSDSLQTTCNESCNIPQITNVDTGSCRINDCDISFDEELNLLESTLISFKENDCLVPNVNTNIVQVDLTILSNRSNVNINNQTINNENCETKTMPLLNKIVINNEKNVLKNLNDSKSILNGSNTNISDQLTILSELKTEENEYIQMSTNNELNLKNYECVYNSVLSTYHGIDNKSKEKIEEGKINEIHSSEVSNNEEIKTSQVFKGLLDLEVKRKNTTLGKNIILEDNKTDIMDKNKNESNDSEYKEVDKSHGETIREIDQNMKGNKILEPYISFESNSIIDNDLIEDDEVIKCKNRNEEVFIRDIEDVDLKIKVSSVSLYTGKESEFEVIKNKNNIDVSNELGESMDSSNHLPFLKMVCSTPVLNEKLKQSMISKKLKNEFDSMSPLNTVVRDARNLKKRTIFETIKEEEEEEEDDSTELSPPKKLKNDACEFTVDLSRKKLEAPAVSLLKKWIPPGSSTPMYIIDDSDTPNIKEDYEDVMKSLNETLMKETTENNLDSIRFTEIMQELTQEIQDQFKDEDLFFENSNEITVIENTEADVTLTNLKKSEVGMQPKDAIKHVVQIIVKEDNPDDASSKNEKEIEGQSHLSIIYANIQDKLADDDEEDLLLEESEFDDKLKKRSRELEFFISSDPKENEDNEDKEWDLLRKLNNDGERYKAVRGRWRSLTIPDPKKNLTYRHWRSRNNLPPLRNICINPLRQINNERAEHFCTELFDVNINQLVRRLEFKRQELRNRLQRDLGTLGYRQQLEQEKMAIEGCSGRMWYNLYQYHIQEVNNLRNKYEMEFNREENISRMCIASLKAASEEVFAFEKFYQGLDDNNPEGSSVLLTKTEIKELMETENMLNVYERYYCD
uniref:Uncharacterized protein n=1 Tax=Clastoptera arizonana TaxID=38151 RepID=A0A1B6E0K9_9HEMI